MLLMLHGSGGGGGGGLGDDFPLDKKWFLGKVPGAGLEAETEAATETAGR